MGSVGQGFRKSLAGGSGSLRGLPWDSQWLELASQWLGWPGVDWASLSSRGLRASLHGLSSELIGLPHNVVAAGVLLGSPGLQNIWRDLRSHRVTYMCFMSGDSHNGPPRAQGGDTDATSYWGNGKLSGAPVGWKTLLQDLGASTSAHLSYRGWTAERLGAWAWAQGIASSSAWRPP